MPHANYPSLAQSASVVQRKGDKRAVLLVQDGEIACLAFSLMAEKPRSVQLQFASQLLVSFFAMVVPWYA